MNANAGTVPFPGTVILIDLGLFTGDITTVCPWTFICPGTATTGDLTTDIGDIALVVVLAGGGDAARLRWRGPLSDCGAGFINMAGPGEAGGGD